MRFDHSVPIKLIRMMIVRPVNETATVFSEDFNSIIGPVPQQGIKTDSIPMDYNWTLQMDNKIISLGLAACSITPSPA
jgi:hypothetical protein